MFRGSPGCPCHTWVPWPMQAKYGPWPGAGAWPVSGQCGCFLNCLGRAGALGCPEGWAELLWGQGEQEAMGQGEERGVWQELVPKIHWALLGCGLEPASGGSSGPSAHALARSAQLRSTGLQLGATTRRQGTAVRPGGSARWASPAQPSSSSPPTAEAAWRAGPCSASNVRQPHFPAASPGGSTGHLGGCRRSQDRVWQSQSPVQVGGYIGGVSGVCRLASNAKVSWTPISTRAPAPGPEHSGTIA